MSMINLPRELFDCVLFDLDNTLIEIPNTWNFFDQIIVDVIDKEYHLPVPSQEERDSLWRSGKEYITILKRWGVADPDDFWHRFDKYDYQKRQHLIQENQLILYNDVIPTLDRLREHKIKIGIVTNTPTELAKMELSAFNLLEYFDYILGLGENQAICKPEPNGIFMILKVLKCNIEKSIFIGDSPVDLLAGKRAGIKTYFIQRGTKQIKLLDQMQPTDYHHITDLKQIFQDHKF